MAKDRVQPLKLEDPTIGGNETDYMPTALNHHEDYVDAHGVTLQSTTSVDDAVFIERDANDNLVFEDKVTGNKKLSELVPPTLATSAPADVTKATAAVGVSTTVARQDHKHDVSTGTPSSVGTSNSEGSATSLARSDHVHNHGAQTSGTLHAAVTTSVAGFMSAADKTKLDGIASSATNTPLSSTAPVNVTKETAAAGTATEAARQDHKHDVTTAAPGSVAIGNSQSEGTATSLARSDHAHAVSGGSPVAVGTSLSDGTNATFARSDHVHTGLTRGANDFSGFTEKTAPANADLLLIEDSAASGVKKKLQISSLSKGAYQTLEAHLTADTTTTSIVPNWVDLLSLSITTGARKLLIAYNTTSDNSNNGKINYFEVTVDGTEYAIRSTSAGNNVPGSAGGSALVSVSAGAHTVKLRWCTSANTGKFTVSTERHGASLLVQEVD